MIRKMRVAVQEFSDTTSRKFISDVTLADVTIPETLSIMEWRGIVKEALELALIGADKIGRK